MSGPPPVGPPSPWVPILLAVLLPVLSAAATYGAMRTDNQHAQAAISRLDQRLSVVESRVGAHDVLAATLQADLATIKQDLRDLKQALLPSHQAHR